MARYRDWWFIASYLLIIGVLFNFARFKFPIPWPDESSFLLQAQSFATTGSFLNAAFTPERIVMWMPPGYMVLMGIIFKITGLSLTVARTVSLCFLFIAYIIATKVANHFKVSTEARVLLTLLFVAPSFLVIGNIARMESLVVFLSLTVLLLTLRGSNAVALSIGMLSVVIHPNGVYFLSIPLIALFVKAVKHRPWRNAGHSNQWIEWMTKYRGQLAAILVSLAAWVGYGVMIANNWNSFIHDMREQVSGKVHYAHFYRNPALDLQLTVLLALLTVAVIKQSVQVAMVIWYSVLCFLVFELGHEMWYQAYYWLSLTVSFLVAGEWLHRRMTVPGRTGRSERKQKLLHSLWPNEKQLINGTRWSFAVMAPVIIYVLCRYVANYSFWGMSYSFGGGPLLTPRDSHFVEQTLLAISGSSLLGSKKPSVEFVGEGSGTELLFYRFLKDNDYSLIENIQVVPHREPDVKVAIYYRDIATPAGMPNENYIAIYVHGKLFRSIEG